MSKMRTINGAYEEIKQHDPNTALTMHAIRVLIKSGEIPSVKAGNKYLVNMDVLEAHLNNYELKELSFYHSEKLKPINEKWRR